MHKKEDCLFWCERRLPASTCTWPYIDPEDFQTVKESILAGEIAREREAVERERWDPDQQKRALEEARRLLDIWSTQVDGDGRVTAILRFDREAVAARFAVKDDTHGEAG